jgi:hypothetical protein
MTSAEREQVDRDRAPKGWGATGDITDPCGTCGCYGGHLPSCPSFERLPTRIESGPISESQWQLEVFGEVGVFGEDY